MPKKTIIIFIATFITVGILIFGGYYLFTQMNKPVNTELDSTKSGNQPFNPFGNSPTKTTNTTDPETGEQTAITPPQQPEAKEISKLTRLTDFAIASATFFEDQRTIPQIEGVKIDPKTPKFETVPSLRYVERSTGHIYERYLDNGITGKISNSTIPNIYEGFFDFKAGTVIYRYLAEDKTISSFMATLGSARGDFLSPDITDISLSTDKKKFFSLVKNSTGVTGIVQSFGDTKKNQVFTSSFDEWLSQWTNAGIFLTTKASSGADGYLYNLNINNGSIKKVFGPFLGLTTNTSNDGASVIYSISVTGRPNLGTLDVKNHTTKDLGLSGLPEKCVWSVDNLNIYCAIPNVINGGQYPDSWYQGIVSFNDRFIKINSKTGEISPINGSSGESIDATHLFLDYKENQLFFTNKKDSTLWSLNLK